MAQRSEKKEKKKGRESRVKRRGEGKGEGRSKGRFEEGLRVKERRGGENGERSVEERG